MITRRTKRKELSIEGETGRENKEENKQRKDKE